MIGAPPRPRTPFFGRRSARTRITRLLDGQRLVSLTGVGGSGKTRLALEVVAELRDETWDEVAWVELAALADPSLVASAVASSLELRLPPSGPPVDALVARLGSSHTLLVFDNCEHVLDGCAGLASQLLDRCPAVRILVTSREPLDVPGEVVQPVSTLSIPDLEGSAAEQVSNASRAESVQLFVDRVQATRPDFRLTSDNVASVVRLCRRLDGIPLALELAAARARVLAPEQIVERLEQGLDVLGRTGRGVPPRHRTMRATLDWSHGLLTGPERLLFRRLGVFGGGAAIGACESICVGSEVVPAHVLDLLTRLVDRSLVVVDDRDPPVRYRLLEPVRQFALERLNESGEARRIRDGHAMWFAEVAEKLAPRLQGPDRSTALARLGTEHDNLRLAWDHAAATGDDVMLARLARALFWFWNFDGHFDEGRRRAEGALERLGPESPARPELLWTSGALAWMQGDYAVARGRLETCVATCRNEDRGDLLPVALREMAGATVALGDLDEGSELYRESVERLPASTHPWDRALSLVVWADVQKALGEGARARELREEARGLFAGLGDPWGLSLAYLGLGVQAARQGDFETARGHAREALALQGAAGDDWNAAQILALLGEVEARAKHPERAAGRLLESLDAFRRVGDRVSLAHVLLCLAAVEAARHRTLRAVRLAGAGRALAETLDAPYVYALATADEHATVVEDLRKAAGDEAFRTEWMAGRAMSVDEAVSFALDVPEHSATVAPGPDEGPASARLRIYGLGPPEVFRGRRRLRAADWTYALPRELLFYLLLHGPRTKEQIGLDLWPDASSEQLRGRFRTALYHLRRALGGTEWVRYEGGRYAFNYDLDYRFDVDLFEARLSLAEKRLESEPEEAARALEQAVDLYRGELLEGEAPDRWASGPRDRLRRRYVQALLSLGSLRSADGAHLAAEEAFRGAVACDELNEEAHRALARCLAEGGDRTAALRHLDELDRLLQRELALEPSSETRELRARLEGAARRPDHGRADRGPSRLP